LIGTLVLESSSLGSGSKRELAVAGGRAKYLAAPKFSGGGHAGFSIDLGLGLDVRLAGRLHGTAAYTFQRINRKTNPGGTGEIDAPVQETVARVGLAVGF